MAGLSGQLATQGTNYANDLNSLSSTCKVLNQAINNDNYTCAFGTVDALRATVDAFNALYQECRDTQKDDPKWLESGALRNVAARANELIGQFNTKAGEGVECISSMSSTCGDARVGVVYVGVAASAAVLVYAAAPAVLTYLGGTAGGPLVTTQAGAASAVTTLLYKGYRFERYIYSAAGGLIGYVYRHPTTGQVVELVWGK